MPLQKNLYVLFVPVLLAASVWAQTGRNDLVQKVSVLSNDPLQLQIQTTAQGTPQAQIISGPERLVIDIPNAGPGPALRNFAVNQGEVRRVRVSQFSTTPLVTRIVVDLNEPQWYRIVPNRSGFLVSLGTDRASTENPPSTQPVIGWVSGKASVSAIKAQVVPFVVQKVSAEKGSAVGKAAPVNGVSVQYANGMLEIHAQNATLSEVLFQIQKQTGAEIAIPSGTEQERVASDFGPGPASEVLAELLNGSSLNFVVVGSEADPKALRSVILSQKSSVPETPPAPAVAQAYTPAPVIDVEQENTGMTPPPPPEEEMPPQPQQPPTGVAAGEAPPS